MSYLPCVEVEPRNGKKADAAIIWLHGLGATGHDFEAIVPELRLPESLAVRFVFPHAPSLPVTINNGMVMPAWYDVLAMDYERDVDEAQLCQSARAVHALIDREIENGIASERIIVAGFSQGGAVGYQAALTYPSELAGLLAMSTYFATYKTVEIGSANKALPIMSMHGTSDGVVPEGLGKMAVAFLTDQGFSPDYKTYPMEHSVCAEQVVDISRWLQSRLPA